MPKRRGFVSTQAQINAIKHQVDLLRLEAGARRRIVTLLDRMMQDLHSQLTAGDLTRFGRARLNELLKSAERTIESYYARAQTRIEDVLAGVAEVQAKQAKGMLDRTLAAIDMSATLPSEAVLARVGGQTLIMGATTEEWWARQAADTAFRFSNAVRQGLTAGDTTEQIAARVTGRAGYPGIIETSRANARALVHTSIQEVASEARRETFKANDDVIEGIRQVSTLDSNTTDICMAYDGAEWDLDGNPINGTTLPYENGVPRHWNCRSVEVPITKTFRDLGLDIDEPRAGKRASEDGPVSGKWTFADFLKTQSEAEQDEMLGAGRAELWRSGTITLQQLLDQHGNPLTLAELKEKYA